MVDLNHVWELGRLDGKNNYTTNNLYTSENNASTTWTGTTGLLYISDYGYAVDSTNRASCLKTSLSSWTENCYKNNWLFKGWMWYFNYNYSSSSATLITVPQVNGAGKLHDGAVYVYNISAVYPSIFLNNNVLYLTGSGTADDPILIESSN